MNSARLVRNVGSMVLLSAALALARSEDEEKSSEESLPFGEEGLSIYQSEDGRFHYLVDARIYLDAAFYDEDVNPLANGADVRSGRAALKAKLDEVWYAELDIEMRDNEVELRDVWIGYTGFGSSILKAGQFKEPFSLEELTSSRYITFMERALPNVFAPGRHLGVGYNRWGRHWQLGVGVFGQEAGESEEGEDQGYGLSGRVTFAPIQTPRRLVHFGAAGAFRSPDADTPDQVRFRERPETRINDTRFLNTGQIKDVEDFVLLGLEGAAVHGPFSAQAEYVRASVSRAGGKPSPSFDGAYAFVSWFATGESRSYVGPIAEFGAIRPKSPRGAVELALRYSTLDLNDGDVLGGEGRNVTLGLNWYLNAHLRLMANYAFVDLDENANAGGDLEGNDDFRVLQFRFQLTF